MTIKVVINMITGEHQSGYTLHYQGEKEGEEYKGTRWPRQEKDREEEQKRSWLKNPLYD